MIFKQRFTSADDFLQHTDLMMEQINDPFIQQKYIGFITISAVSVYELAIKDIIFRFSDQKHKVLGVVSRHNYERLNVRIKLNELRKDHIRQFGENYVKKFNNILDNREQNSFRAGKGSIQTAYANIISWRNIFAHTGESPTTTTYAEVKNFYNLGKEVIYSLDEALIR